jgi:hypothetical protein
VFAVPRSMAMSSVMKSKNPIDLFRVNGYKNLTHKVKQINV